MRFLKPIFFVLLGVILWSLLVGYGFLEGYLLRPITSGDTPEAFKEAAQAQIDDEFVGNLALALIEDGAVAQSYFYGANGQSIDAHSAFPVASISKWLTSVGILKLVERGILDLDQPVDDYLTRWHLPPSNFDNRKVTIRRLLSHSAGLVDGLGYAGFTAEDFVQSLEESLTQAADAPWSEGVARVGYEPGTEYRYSGASYALLQLLIEEVTQLSFQEYMTQEIFEPLGMQNSSYVLADSAKISLVSVYTAEGSPRPLCRFTAQAAASLMTSTADLSQFMLALQRPSVLLADTTLAMMSKTESYYYGVGIYGLGARLYSQTDKGSNIIGHDGSGNNAINASARMDLLSKSGIIVMETGNYSMASVLADEWFYWKAGVADRVVIELNLPIFIIVGLTGYVLVILMAILWVRKSRKQRMALR